MAFFLWPQVEVCFLLQPLRWSPSPCPIPSPTLGMPLRQPITHPSKKKQSLVPSVPFPSPPFPSVTFFTSTFVPTPAEKKTQVLFLPGQKRLKFFLHLPEVPLLLPGGSPPQELEVGARRAPYLLVPDTEHHLHLYSSAQNKKQVN